MPIVADHYRFVVGVDTHAATHTYALITASGQQLDQQTFPTSTAGLDRARSWIGRRTGQSPDQVLVAAEGTGSYGALMAQHLDRGGYRVVEAPTPSVKRLRGRGKTDAWDAHTAAGSILATELEQLRERRSGQLHTVLAVLTTAREQIRTDKVRSVNALTALLRTHALGIDARKRLTKAQIQTVAAWRPRREGLGQATARAEAVRLAQRIGQLDQELKDNQQRLGALVAEHAPALLDKPGIGPVTAATVLRVWSHPGRIRSEAAFAQIAGACPIPASSGKTCRHRLNRGGDRQLNQALHTIVLARIRTDPATGDYVQRRIAQGRTKREIMRCLKRYVSRQIYRTLAAHPPVCLAA